jgi:xanthine/CO dehydrogenase XdhC/CoxF family maturation factor
MSVLATRPPGTDTATTEWKRLTDFASAKGGNTFALATLLAREGSSYRQPGARLLIAPDGSHAGCLSGGCLEDGVAQVGLRVLRTGVAERLRIDTRPHFGCPGILDLWIEPLAKAFISELAHALAARTSPWVVTWPGAISDGGLSAGTSLQPRAPTAFKSDALVLELGLLPRLIVASATSDAVPLCELARWMGWDVHQVVHAAEAQGGGHIGNARVMPPEAFARAFPPDARTACVIMTHHLGRDLAYLRHALAATYPYVGLLGSRRRRETLLGELGELGVLQDDTIARRLRAPVGLDLGADEPRGIALAIVAEIQAAWAGAAAGPLSARVGPLHAPLEPSIQ